MKIPIDRPAKGHKIACPWCSSRRWWRHGSYTRTFFHSQRRQAISESRRVQRYLCRAATCGRSFSRLPHDVIPWCRFFYSDLLRLGRSLSAGLPPRRLARCLWHVGHRVITRARVLYERLANWVETLYREITDGAIPLELEGMEELVVDHYWWGEFTHRWCRHLYPGHGDMRPPNTV